MTDPTSATRGPSGRPRRRDVAARAGILTALAAAAAAALAGGADGTALTVVSVLAAAAVTALLLPRSGRRSPRRPAAHAPARGAPVGDGRAIEAAAGPQDPETTLLWRMRTTVRDKPGSLAALCTVLAGHRVDILSLQTHPLTDGAVDEFLLRAPAGLAADDLRSDVTDAGGSDTWLERAVAHDLVDTPTRMLALATRTALDSAELPLALRELLGRCTIRSIPERRGATPSDEAAPVPPEGVLAGTRMRLRDPAGGTLVIERPQLPFTPAEFARAQALTELDARLGPRVPAGRDVLTLPEGGDITVRRAGTTDVAAAREMHDRCSPATLRLRYHGPVADTERYLDHLLGPRFGRTLLAQTSAGRVVALGHLLWDGEETEVALLVEDDFQRRGIGGRLLRRLVRLAAEAGCERIYALTQPSNTAMVAAMRGLGLPLDYQVEEGMLVVTASLRPVRSPRRDACEPSPRSR